LNNAMFNSLNNYDVNSDLRVQFNIDSWAFEIMVDNNMSVYVVVGESFS